MTAVIATDHRADIMLCLWHLTGLNVGENDEKQGEMA